MILFLEQTAAHIRQHTNHNVLLLEHIILARHAHPTLESSPHTLHVRQPRAHTSLPHAKNHQSRGRQQVIEQLAGGRVATRANAVLHDTALYASAHRAAPAVVFAQQQLQRHHARFEARREWIQLLHDFIHITTSQARSARAHVSARELGREVVLVVDVVEGGREGQSNDAGERRGLLQVQQEVGGVLVVA